MPQDPKITSPPLSRSAQRRQRSFQNFSRSFSHPMRITGIRSDPRITNLLCRRVNHLICNGEPRPAQRAGRGCIAALVRHNARAPSRSGLAFHVNFPNAAADLFPPRGAGDSRFLRGH